LQEEALVKRKKWHRVDLRAKPWEGLWVDSLESLLIRKAKVLKFPVESAKEWAKTKMKD